MLHFHFRKELPSRKGIHFYERNSSVWMCRSRSFALFFSLELPLHALDVALTQLEHVHCHVGLCPLQVAVHTDARRAVTCCVATKNMFGSTEQNWKVSPIPFQAKTRQGRVKWCIIFELTLRHFCRRLLGLAQPTEAPSEWPSQQREWKRKREREKGEVCVYNVNKRVKMGGGEWTGIIIPLRFSPWLSPRWLCLPLQPPACCSPSPWTARLSILQTIPIDSRHPTQQRMGGKRKCESQKLVF